MNTRKIRKLRWVSRPALIAALLLALLAATAVAVVLRGSALRDALNATGAKEMVERVAELGATDAAGGFALTLDEVIWEGENLYVSCTMSVPDDGKSYLIGLMTPTLNGERVDYQSAYYFDNSFGPIVSPIGGEFPAVRTLILPMIADSKLLKNGPAELGMKAEFFSTDLPIVPIDDSEGRFDGPDMERMDGPCVKGAYVYRNSDALRCTDGIFPSIDLTEYKEVASIDWRGEMDGWLANGADAETIAATGLIDRVATRELTVTLDEAVLSETELNDVAEHRFMWRDMTFTVERFHMTHFSLELGLRIEREGGFQRDEYAAIPGIPTDPNMLLGLAYSDGREIGSGSEQTDKGVNSSLDFQDDGSLLYTLEGSGIYPINSLDALLLAPEYFTVTDSGQGWATWENEWLDVDDPVAVLAPIFNEEIHQGELDDLARLEAIANWQSGDPGQTVYATEDGTYYHYKPDCMGMLNPSEWAIEDVLAAGKPACPVCIGGVNSRIVGEER